MADMDRWGKARWVVILAVMVALGLGLAWIAHDSQTNAERLDEVETEAAVNREAAETNEAAAEALAAQVERLCGKRPTCEPVVEPDDLPEPPEVDVIPGPQGEPGPPPSPEQVLEAVRRYCAVTDCQGPKGPPGEPGESITAEQVAAAVATYCDARGECAGPEGATGPIGPRGAAGPPPSADQIAQAVADYCDARDACAGPQGDPGRPPTAEEIAAAVNDYCATHDQCRGPKGDPGQDGEDAFPFTFKFTVPADDPVEEDRTYRCTITHPDEQVTCDET